MFEERPASKRSLARRGVIKGVGINDAPYQVSYRDNDGKNNICPYYGHWYNMMVRAYCPHYHKKKPTYIGCSVDERWHKFMDFRRWMENQDWEGKYLDKDIKMMGNKIYSPDTCLFVTLEVNSLLLCGRSSDGNGYPIGVRYDKQIGKFRTELSVDGKTTYIGCYDTVEETQEAYVKAKSKRIKEVAGKYEPEVKDALIRHAKALEDTLVDRTEQEDTEQERLGV